MAFVVPEEEQHLPDQLAEAGQMISKLDWKLHDIPVIPVRDPERIEDTPRHEISQEKQED
jgi:hypothetical protein